MCLFLVIREKTILFQALPWAPLWAHPPHSSRPQSRRKPTQGFTCSRRFQDRQQAEERVLGLDVFLCGVRALDAVVCERAHLAQPVPPGTRIQSGAQRESGKAFTQRHIPGTAWCGLQCVTQCLCISLHIRLYREPRHVVPKSEVCVLTEPGARPTLQFRNVLSRLPEVALRVFVPGQGKSR